MPNLFEYSYRVIPLNLSAGYTDFEIVTDAEKIVYASPTDGPEITVRLQLKANDGIPLRPQGELEAPFQRIYITAAAVSKTIYLLIGSPKDIQLTGRDVSISGTINARDYAGYANSLGQLYEATDWRSNGPSVGNFAQLLNPAGSGKIVELLYMEVACDNATATLAFQYGRLDGALTNLTRKGASHNIGAPISTAEVRNQNSGSITDVWGQLQFLANLPRQVNLPLTLSPGQGFATSIVVTVAYACSTRFVWREYPQ